jgi:hypothetical protein
MEPWAHQAAGRVRDQNAREGRSRAIPDLDAPGWTSSSQMPRC